MCAAAAVFVMAAGRSHEVPEEALGAEARGLCNAARYRAYPAMKQVKEGQILLALCWAHQRRDFIEAERGRPELNAWASAWLARIGNLYQLNAARLQVWQKDAVAFAVADGALRGAVAEFERVAAAEAAQAELPVACRKVLESLAAHWAGLTVFVEHPEVPMDNNAAALATAVAPTTVCPSLTRRPSCPPTSATAPPAVCPSLPTAANPTPLPSSKSKSAPTAASFAAGATDRPARAAATAT